MKRFNQGCLFLAAGALSAALAPAAQAAGPYQYYAVTPCRVVDTRSTTRVQRAVPRNLTVKGICGVPADAVAASLNATVVAPTAGGWLAMWPSDGAPANVSTLNFLAGEPAIANGALVVLAATTPDLTVFYQGTMTTTEYLDVILDVTGYFK